MNLTLSVDDQVVERARDVARRQGQSLNGLVRQYIERLAGERTGEQLAAELRAMWNHEAGNSLGRPYRREDAYDGRL